MDSRFTLTLLAALSLINPSFANSISVPGDSSFVAPAGFPTSAFASYWLPPSPSKEPQPIIQSPVLNLTFPLGVTNQSNIPQNDTDPIIFPEPLANISAEATQNLIDGILAQISEIIQGDTISGNCSKCIASLIAAKSAALFAPASVPDAMVSLCKKFKFQSNSSCEVSYEASTYGAVWTQVLKFADVGGQDGQWICNTISSTFCPKPWTTPTNTTGLFPKPKPVNATAPCASGKRVKVLHLSDFHLDPRYAASSEANCSSSMCCRTNTPNSAVPVGQISLPASLYGSFKCDTPYDLALAALQAVGPLTGTGNGKESLAWTIYTGDLVAHDPQNQLSRAFTEYTETSVYSMFKQYITGPVFAALGNHDSNPANTDAPHTLPGRLGEQQSWHYDSVAALWQHEGWITTEAAAEAKTHYGAYSIKTHYGLRIITFNTDFYYRGNYFSFINTTNPDNSGMFKFMIAELQAAEDAGERVWIVGHVLSGWDGSNPIANPSDLFYQIIDRYSPHVIAAVFFGHTHEDQVMIYYANNGTAQTAGNALTAGWIGPSVTPLTNLNSGFRLYEVDTGSFDIYEAWTFVANVSAFSALSTTGPTFKLEYSTRDAYALQAGWTDDAPLNATFWHRVTEAMERNHTLVQMFNGFQGKGSVKSPNCTSAACVGAKVCYMRSGSVALGRACAQGFASVQSEYTGTG
ncbi:hypothetical protein K432DRAFT_427684 [Lepidopterella palustris CBS 459.81]|uniref:Calcineurin-like phosphoesterase domain-containing protein n=1 Tax=Lepidopterella palustris CBS 459.81 TaxID=1314670 RepID=A0A8E2E5V2_9PEZI|nr:hypothetical protein K432DRAFT_427684 [Lepidopterella palustris CBS 459.81]